MQVHALSVLGKIELMKKQHGPERCLQPSEVVQLLLAQISLMDGTQSAMNKEWKQADHTTLGILGIKHECLRCVPILTVCEQFKRKSKIHWHRNESIPNDSNLECNILRCWNYVLWAELKSMNSKCAYERPSTFKYFETLCNMTASSTEWLARYAKKNWYDLIWDAQRTWW